MNKLKARYLVIFFVFAVSCGSPPERFPIEKRYWTQEDYKNVIFQIEYKTPKGEDYPRFSNPETSMVIRKLVDAENYKVMLEDPELGLNFKNDIASEFFDQYRKVTNLYGAMDRQDKYIYAEEVVELEKFGLGLQIRYFDLGNQRIKQGSDSPSDVNTFVYRNEMTIVNNFNMYLDNVKNEGSFSSFAPLLAEGITVHFFKLIETFPDADYRKMVTKATAMSEKTKVPEIKSALNSLLAKLESVKKPE